MDPLQSICPVNSSSFINTSLSLLQVPFPADFFSYFDPISPYQLHPSLPFAILLSQPALPPPFPFFRRYFYQPPLQYIEFGYFFFLLSIPDQTELNSAPLFSPLFLWVFSLLTVDCCISLVSPPVPGS